MDVDIYLHGIDGSTLLELEFRCVSSLVPCCCFRDLQIVAVVDGEFGRVPVVFQSGLSGVCCHRMRLSLIQTASFGFAHLPTPDGILMASPS